MYVLHLLSVYPSNLIQAWGGAPQIRGEIKTLCKGAVALYGIPGDYTPTEITAHVKWLTGKQGIFKYGAINLKVRSTTSRSQLN
jgi:hypothetical protein